MSKKKININDPKAWKELNFDDVPVPEALRRSDRIVNSARANRIKALDPKIKANLSKAVTASLKKPEVQQARTNAARKGSVTKSSDPNYQKLMTEVNRKKASKPEFANNVRNGINAKRLADPTSMRKGGSTQVKACANDKGETFASRVLAAKAYDVDPRVMGKWIKKGKDGWKYI